MWSNFYDNTLQPFLKQDLPDIAWALAAIIISAYIARFISKKIKNKATRIVDSITLVNLFATVARVVIIIIGAIIALRIVNLDGAVTSLVAGAGIVGLALGFAFQDIASNFIAGVVLSIQNKLEIGDLIQVNDVFGTVKNIDLRVTEIQTLEGQIVYMPNKEIFLNQVTDYSKLGRRRVDLAIGVSYSDDLTLAKDTTIKAIKSLKEVINDQPIDMYFNEFGDSSINLTARFWVKFSKQTDWLEAQSNAIIAIKQAYDKAGLNIPFPIRTLDIPKTTLNKLSK